MFAVTTRNKLRSRRHFFSMIWAWWQIRRQLARTTGMLAYTTAIANATEFFTLTLWEKEIDMILFIASEDHRDMMWNARQWSESFWSMRWVPSGDEAGTWDGKAFSDVEASGNAGPHYIGPGYLEVTDVPEGLRPYLSKIIRKAGPATLPLSAVIGRIPARSPLAFFRITRSLAAWRSHGDVVYSKVCLGLGECLVLVVWNRNAQQDAAALTGALLREHSDAWAMCFKATDDEIGHWNKIRMREIAPASID